MIKMNKQQLIQILEENDFELLEECIEGKHSIYEGKIWLWFDYIGDKIKWYSEDQFNSYEKFYEYSREKIEILEKIFEDLLNRYPEIRDFIYRYEYEDCRVGYTNIYIYIEQ